jgi:hypothetical protein
VDDAPSIHPGVRALATASVKTHARSHTIPDDLENVRVRSHTIPDDPENVRVSAMAVAQG